MYTIMVIDDDESKGRSLDDAITCWKYKKSMQGHNRYEKSDKDGQLYIQIAF